MKAHAAQESDCDLGTKARDEQESPNLEKPSEIFACILKKSFQMENWGSQ